MAASQNLLANVPQSPLTKLYQGLQKAPELAGVPLLLSAKFMPRNGAPPRIVLYPTGGKIVNPRNKSSANRDVDRAVIAHIWGRDFDQVCYLQTLFVQALLYQGAGGDPPAPAGATGGIYWTASDEEWEITEDSNRQGEELYMVLTAICSLDKVAKNLGAGQVAQVLLSQLTTTLSQAMGATDGVANVASTSGFSSAGILTIDSEQMLFTGATPTSFTGLQRGVNGTTPATHAQNATVNVS